MRTRQHQSRRVAMQVIGLCSLAGLFATGCSKDVPPASITIFAAASAGEALREIADRYREVTGQQVMINAAATSTLAKQLIEGAPGDLFLSADESWMDKVEAAGQLRPGSRHDLLGNDLVVVGAKNAAPFDLKAGDPPASLLAAKRIAVADPAHVPAGRYATEALRSMGWLDVVAPKLLSAPDVRAALRLVEMGEADLGIVYLTDSRGSETTALLARFPAESHSPILYPVAITKTAREGSEAFLTFLTGDVARGIFAKAGFRVLETP
ncbi:MAG: molybdate ABC transporter substrate-binding protein [Phycisphaerae bacterium]|nr:molybdate ABC transporter substrate-binding protein [Phycisphaerae bacterium]